MGTKYKPKIHTAIVKKTGKLVKVYTERYTTNPYYVVGSSYMEHYWYDELDFMVIK